MKYKLSIIIYIFLSGLFILSAFNLEAGNKIVSISDTLKVATYNIRIKTTADTGERSWKKRKKQVTKLITNHRFDVFGVQEIVDNSQERDLKFLLPAYNIFSKGRDDSEGKTGEKLAVMYNNIRFTEQDKGFFFLSETPAKASRGWDAALNRICIWIKLYDNVTNKPFYFFNVHFDHVGTSARAESAKLVVSKIKEIAGSETAFCVGDFNASPYETSVYNTMTTYMADSRATSETDPKGYAGTFNGWDISSKYFSKNVEIDYIFVTNIQIFTYSVLNDIFSDNIYPSDHFPVMITCKIR